MYKYNQPIDKFTRQLTIYNDFRERLDKQEADEHIKNEAKKLLSGIDDKIIKKLNMITAKLESVTKSFGHCIKDVEFMGIELRYETSITNDIIGGFTGNGEKYEIITEIMDNYGIENVYLTLDFSIMNNTTGHEYCVFKVWTLTSLLKEHPTMSKNLHHFRICSESTNRFVFLLGNDFTDRGRTEEGYLKNVKARISDYE